MLKLFHVDRAERETSTKDYRSKYGERENNSLTFIREHLTHGIIDIVSSLIAIAVPINSASVFFFPEELSFACWSAIIKEFSSLLRPSFTVALILMGTTMFQLDYLRPMILSKLALEVVSLMHSFQSVLTTDSCVKSNSAAAFIFALALVCAGQMSSITVTLAGQSVSEGFIEWKITVWIINTLKMVKFLIPSFFSHSKLAFLPTTHHQMYQSNPFRGCSHLCWSWRDQFTSRCVTSRTLCCSSIRRFPSRLSDFIWGRNASSRKPPRCHSAKNTNPSTKSFQSEWSVIRYPRNTSRRWFGHNSAGRRTTKFRRRDAWNHWL